MATVYQGQSLPGLAPYVQTIVQSSRTITVRLVSHAEVYIYRLCNWVQPNQDFSTKIKHVAF